METLRIVIAIIIADFIYDMLKKLLATIKANNILLKYDWYWDGPVITYLEDVTVALIPKYKISYRLFHNYGKLISK